MAQLPPNEADKDKPEMFAPRSKFMEAVEYDPKNNTLDITFKSGTKIRYTQVETATFLSFKQSPTHDAYYSRGIKGNLPSIKLVDKSIGRKESTPLKTVTKERMLNAGLKSSRARIERIQGGIARAFAGAGLSPSGLS